MKITHTKDPLPTLWHQIPKYGDLIKHEAAIKVSAGSRLRLKFLVFDSWQDMDRFWNKALHRGWAVDRHTYAVCSKLDATVTSFKNGTEKSRIEVDKRYFAVIGFIRKHINLDVIAHEAAHAAFAYAFRARAVKWVDVKNWHEEEPVAYPTGRLTRMIYNHCIEEGILQHEFPNK